MAHHAAPATHRRGSGTALSPGSAGLVLPVVAGAAYGLWAASIQRYGGEVTGGNIALGFVTGVLVAVLCFGVHRWSAAQAGRHFFARAGAWGVLAGVSIGFLHSLANGTVLWSVVLGALVAGGVFLGTYYRYYSSNEYA
ncbi:hypothetical protein GTW43_16860 [Streptomyces sp. SID5785]|uniref:hypothetical protein n=1 Tax=Streptomyces sp. SID5785 TaxID=2690309 RepID=UPI0013619FA6|nr:hypothetical protein [Streptomyces sp. SID5785]MZD06755.1 hypothetical protein [Streptomyces sp. SID5785]